MSSFKVGVIGAGIVGLMTAEEVVRQYPSADVTILAEKFNVDTTSDGAAGLFMLVSKFKGPDFQTTRKWVYDSYEYYMNLLHNDCGIFELYGYLLSKTTRQDCRSPVMESVLPIYRDCTQEELLEFPGNWKYGSYTKTLVTRGRTFMPWSLERLKQSNVKVRERTIHSFSELEGEFDIVFNCSGLGAFKLCNDDSVVPIRGQVIKAKTPGLDKFYIAGEDTYIIPSGLGVTTLGGTHQFGYHNMGIRQNDTDGILERCSSLLPQLKNSQVLWEWAGLRPFRNFTRVEAEKIGKLKVVHNYGHGGCGVTTAPGTAKYAVSQMNQLLISNSKL